MASSMRSRCAARGRDGGRRLLLASLAAAALGCDRFPRDPEDTLQVARGGVLTVGVTDAPPWIVRDGARAVGPEAELVLEFARSIGAEVEWRFAPQDEQLEAFQTRARGGGRG